MTKTIAINDLKKQIYELIKFAAKGSEVIIIESDKPMARIVPISFSSEQRIAGLNKGEIWVSDDFDEPLDQTFWTNGL